MRSLIQIFLILALAQTNIYCNRGQNINPTIIKVDSTVSQKALKVIRYKDGLNVKRNLFYTRFTAEYYTNDELEGRDIEEAVFTGRYSWKNDTLALSVFCGDLGTIGFTIGISKDTYGTLYYQQCGHTKSKIKVSLSDTLSICGKIPCSFSELIISKFPDTTEEDVIFGFVNFKSTGFYYEEKNGFDKLRTDMSFYFKASFDFYKSRHYIP
jgi:hypothetical protein